MLSFVLFLPSIRFLYFICPLRFFVSMPLKFDFIFRAVIVLSLSPTHICSDMYPTQSLFSIYHYYYMCFCVNILFILIFFPQFKYHSYSNHWIWHLFVFYSSKIVCIPWFGKCNFLFTHVIVTLFDVLFHSKQAKKGNSCCWLTDCVIYERNISY